MAKTSQINRNKKREKLVAQYAAKRAELKKIAEDMKVPAEERFAARLRARMIGVGGEAEGQPQPRPPLGRLIAGVAAVKKTEFRALVARRIDAGQGQRLVGAAIDQPLREDADLRVLRRGHRDFLRVRGERVRLGPGECRKRQRERAEKSRSARLRKG